MTIIDFELPDGDITDEIDFEVDNLPGPDEFEALHGYSIDDEPDDAA